MKDRLHNIRRFIAFPIFSRGLALGASQLLAVIALGAIAFTALTPRTADTQKTSFIATLSENPSELSEEDVALYQSIFRAIESGQTSSVPEALPMIQNQRLMGYALAALYTSPGYSTTADELASWLASYSDHPQAQSIARMASARGIKAPAITEEAPLKGDGYAEHLGRSSMPDSWYRGLSLWREKDYIAAYALFEAIGTNKTLSGWQRAAGYYWAHRAAEATKNSSAARANLQAAAAHKTTFYGLLATEKLGAAMADSRAPSVSSSLRNNPRAIRAALLSQLGRNEEAENELRRLYSAADKNSRAGIITLSHELNLANLQVRLAGLSELSPEEEIFASYPMPQYVLDAQDEQSPALLLAIARNESSFREMATSGAGAVGMMQMLPSTASSIERRVGLDALRVASSGNNLGPVAERLSDPATSVRYSAKYLDILAREPAIGTNLVRILAAYNAGPGTVAGWQSMADNITDPLLYIESIPYPETRNYVMQVLAHSWVYASLLGEVPASLKQLNHSEWPVLIPKTAS